MRIIIAVVRASWFAVKTCVRVAREEWRRCDDLARAYRRAAGVDDDCDGRL